jgi:trk system potassium uptake protein TrkH
VSEGSDTLRYAVRLPVVAKYLGQLGIMLALLTLAPLATALWFHEWPMVWSLLGIIALLFTVALPAARRPPTQTMRINEALVIAASAFIITPLLMSIPFSLAGLPFDDALFEAISAITTTGLSTIRHLGALPHTLLFTRAWMQWYGGLGIVVLWVALQMGHYTTSRRLAEPGGGEAFETTARTHARRTLAVYLLLTVVGVAIATPLIGDGFTTLIHILSAVSTGGFSSFDQSLAAFPNWSQRFALMFIAFSGAIPLVLYHRLFTRRARELVLDREVWLLLVMVGVTTLLLWWLSSSEQPERFLHSLLLALSAQSTTGFSSSDVALLSPAAKLVTIVSMLSGGGLGSTAGGIKILRLILFFKLLQLYMRRSAAPEHAVIKPRLAGRALGEEELLRALLVVQLYVLVVGFSWLLFVIAGYQPLDALFEVVSAVGTVGLSTGITEHSLPLLLKGVLAVDMLLGRLEIIALLVLCYPPTWFGRRTE